MVRVGLLVFTALMSWSPAVALAVEQHGRWVDLPPAAADEEVVEWPAAQVLDPIKPPRRHQGVGWYELMLTVPDDGDWVLDFRNSSVIGEFTHWVLDADGQLVATLTGGQLSPAADDYLLRHGRNITLEAGDYRILTLVDSPFLLAEPVPHLFPADDYARAAGYTAVFTLVGIGIFLALGFYYLVLGLWRRSASDLLYVGFITGNLIYNSTALLVTRAISPEVWFYGISAPILISNVVYVLFVLCLLRIRPADNLWLYRAGLAVIFVLVSFWPLALLWPQWSLELCRIGVALFAVYGFVAGIVRTLQGSRVARLYLLANLVFLIPAIMAISVQQLPASGVFLIEHLGLLAVLLEVLMLSWVMSYQVGQLQKRRVQLAAEAERALLLSNLAQQVPGMVCQFQQHPDGRISMPFVTAQIGQLLEMTPDQVREDASPLFAQVHPDDISGLWSSLRHAKDNARIWQREFRMLLPNAGLRWLSAQAHPEWVDDGSMLWHAYLSDVTARREAEAEVRHLASHDVLTGVLNRASFERRLSSLLTQAERAEESVALLFIDLDYFKPINDRHGHAVGDELLAIVASRIQQAVRVDDPVARIGGDEFVVALHPIDEHSAALAIAETIRQSIEQPVTLQNLTLQTSASIGVAISPHQGTTLAQLTAAADRAMYRSKAAGRNQVLM